MDKNISLVEVGPRDGLQNTSQILTFGQHLKLIRALFSSGLSEIEGGSFVKPDRVPSMAHTKDIATYFKGENTSLWYLVPNQKGLRQALEQGVQKIALFTAASKTFNEKNIGMTLNESLKVIRSCFADLKTEGYSFLPHWADSSFDEKKVKIRLYISTVISCPYQGPMDPSATLSILEKLEDLPIAQYSLGDTLGVGTPKSWQSLLSLLPQTYLNLNRIAMHCHDTYGCALASIAEGLNYGITTFDSSIGGLGGCPYAPGATGNLATEDLVYFLNKEGFETGVNLEKLLTIFGGETTGTLCNVSKVFKALAKKKSP